MARRYTQEQLAEVLRRSGANSWESLLEFISTHRVANLTYDQCAELQEDIEKLKDRGEPFIEDPVQLYRLIDSIQPSRVSIGPGSPTPEAEAR